MNDFSPHGGASGYGTLIEPATLRIERLLPGPIERVWSYLTDSDLRRKWLASGIMDGRVGGQVEFVWRNEELSDPPSQRPEGADEEHRMTCEITEFEPPRRLAITWGKTGGVVFELAPEGGKVRLTVTHRRVLDRAVLVSVSSGWHAHLDVLVARLEGREPAPFWDAVKPLRAEYERRTPA
jgi:uncharacterized protein YndB with AHSA1/START domain